MPELYQFYRDGKRSNNVFISPSDGEVNISIAGRVYFMLEFLTMILMRTVSNLYCSKLAFQVRFYEKVKMYT